MRILAIGDVSGEIGLRMVRRRLPALRQEYEIDFTVVNGENADVLGLKIEQAELLRHSGADVVTLGNHAWGRRQLVRVLEDHPWILRPANFTVRAPGEGFLVFTLADGRRLGVVSLIGRLFCDWNADSPFTVMERILREGRADLYIVDFHGEATSEKAAFAYHFDGRVAAIFGTHTHVQTSDEMVLPKGSGFITDLGMTGGIYTILGVEPEESVNRFLGGVPGSFRAPESGPAKLEGAVFELGDDGLCRNVERLREVSEIK